MTKATPNPRRYSRGQEGLATDQPLNVYMSVRVGADDLERTAALLDRLTEAHPEAQAAVVAYRHENGRVVLVLEIGMGPARDALRGIAPELHAGYAFLWALTKAFYYAHPVFCTPPTHDERIVAARRRTTAHADRRLAS